MTDTGVPPGPTYFVPKPTSSPGLFLQKIGGAEKEGKVLGTRLYQSEARLFEALGPLLEFLSFSEPKMRLLAGF